MFHSIRHTSVTYKLKLNGGDVKSVQGDSGHSQSSMVTDVYSHILDEGRRNNARLFEDAFYSGRNEGADADVKPQEEGRKESSCHTAEELENGAEDSEAAVADETKKESDMETLLRLLKNPEIAGVLKTLSQAM